MDLAQPSGLPISVSIMLAGLTGHVSLPPIYAEMKTPSAFRPTLYLSFAVMFLFYAAVAGCGYLLYGEGASVLITQDMGNAGGDSVLSHILIQLVNLGITFKLYCSVPTCVVVLVDIAQNLYLDSKGVQLSDGATDAVRFVLWGLTVLGSIATYTSLKYVTALIGINSMLISVLLPILFYIILHGKQMTRSHRAVLAAIVAFSVCLTLVITYVDFLEFLGSLADLADSDEADDALGEATPDGP